MASNPSKNNASAPLTRFTRKPWIWGPFALILVILIILTQIDLESVKENLIEKIASETGMKVEIDSIGFGFSHGLGLQCKGVKVNTPEGDHYSVDRLDLLAAWSPLLSGEFKIKSAALEHPVIKLEIPKTSEKERPAKKEEPKKEMPSKEPGFVSSETIKSTTKKVKETPLTIEKFVVSDGEVTFTQAGSSKQLLLNVDGTFELNRNEGMDISAREMKVQTGAMLFEGEGTVSNLTADNARVAMNLKTGGFSLQDIQPALQFFEVSDLPLESMDVDRLLLKNEFPLRSLSKIENLKSEMTGHIEFKIRNTLLKDNVSIKSLEGGGNWAKGVVTHNFSGSALGSDFKLNGKLPFSGLDKDSISNVEWNNLDIEKLPLKKDMAWVTTQGTVSGKASLTGPLPKEVHQLNGSLEFQATGLVLKQDNQIIEMSQLTGHGIFDKGHLQHELKGNIWGSDFNIKGKFPLNKDKQILNEQINWASLDVAQLPLPSGEGLRPVEGLVSGNLTVTGPVPDIGKSFAGQLKGSFKAQNLKLQNTDKTLALKHLEGSGDYKNHQANYDLNGEVFSGTIHSDGRVILSASGSSPPVLNNKIEFANIDMSQLPIETQPEQGAVSGTVKLKGPLPEAENILTSNLSIDIVFKVSNLKMSADNLPVNIQQLEGKTNLKKGKLTHNLNGDLFGGKMATNGNMVFHKNNVTADSNIELKHINLNWVPLVFENGPSSGILTGKLNIKVPLPSDGKISSELKLKGNFEGEKLVHKNNQVEQLQLDLTSSGATQAKFTMQGIKLDNRNFKKASGWVKVTEGNIDLTNGKIWPKNGLVQLAGNFKPESGSYRVKFKGDQLKVEELLPPHLVGPLKLSGALTGTLPQGASIPGLPEYSKNLSGKLKIQLVDGAIPQLGAVEGLLTLLNPTTAMNAQKEGLSYDYLGGDFEIVKGVVHTENFEMKSPQVNLSVVGKANLVEDTVLAQVKAMPLQMLDKTIKAIPLLGQILGGGKKGGVIETYFKVDGKLSKPDFMLLPHKSLTEKPGSILKGLMNLPKNLGGK